MEEASPLAGISHQRFATSTHKKVDISSSSGTTPTGMDAHNSHRPRLYRQRAERASIQIMPSASAQQQDSCASHWKVTESPLSSPINKRISTFFRKKQTSSCAYALTPTLTPNSDSEANPRKLVIPPLNKDLSEISFEEFARQYQQLDDSSVSNSRPNSARNPIQRSNSAPPTVTRSLIDRVIKKEKDKKDKKEEREKEKKERSKDNNKTIDKKKSQEKEANSEESKRVKDKKEKSTKRDKSEQKKKEAKEEKEKKNSAKKKSKEQQKAKDKVKPSKEELRKKKLAAYGLETRDERNDEPSLKLGAWQRRTFHANEVGGNEVVLNQLLKIAEEIRKGQTGDFVVEPSEENGEEMSLEEEIRMEVEKYQNERRALAEQAQRDKMNRKTTAIHHHDGEDFSDNSITEVSETCAEADLEEDDDKEEERLDDEIKRERERLMKIEEEIQMLKRHAKKKRKEHRSVKHDKKKDKVDST